jgi:carbonic anhydrase/acetyltransferase-like protein (isoleucine patch superfamily)
MEKKYELTGNDCEDCYRIRALKSFQLITGKVIRKGDLGGLVDGEHNLSQEGNCWIGYNARAFGRSRVMDNAVMKDYSEAYDNSTVSGNAIMKDHSLTRGNSTISGNAVLKDYSRAFDNSTVSGNAVLKDYSRAFDNSTISGNAVMKDWSNVFGTSIITGNALLQAHQNIKYGTVTTDLLGTKDWIGTLYAEFGLVPKDNKVVLYKKVWSTDDPDVFKSDYRQNFSYKIGKISRARKVNENVFKSCASGLHFTSLEFVNNYGGDTILECEVKVPDIVTVQVSKVRARKCRVIRVYKGE